VIDSSNIVSTIGHVLVKPILSQSVIAAFARHFSAILATGLAPLKAIDLIAKQTNDKSLLAVLSLIVTDMQKGSNLAQAFSKQERIFGTFFCSIISSGEPSGNLKNLLVKAAEYCEKNDLFQKKMARKLKYPLFIWIGTLGSLSTMLLFLIPAAMERISQAGGTLPAPTEIILSLLNFLHSHVLLLIICATALISIFIGLFLLSTLLEWVDFLFLKIPIYGNLRRKNSLRRISLSLSLLLSTGLEFPKALKIAIVTVKAPHLGNLLYYIVRNEPNDRHSLLEILKNRETFPSLIGEMLLNSKKRQTREGELFTKIADFYQEEVETALSALFLVVGPAMMTFLGLVGGGVLLGLYLPLFKLVGKQ
jgi:type IV pilus assembly protein PilC